MRRVRSVTGGIVRSQVASGTEIPVGTSQDHDTDSRVVPRLFENSAEFIEHREIDGISSTGPIEGDVKYTGILFEGETLHSLPFHDVSPES